MTRRKELCDKALEYLLEHGVANVSLRPLAEAIGTSARLLIFHFESKDGLIAAVMEAVQKHMQEAFGQLRHPPQRRDVMLAFWELATSPHNRRHVRMLFEMQVLALRNPDQFGRYLEAGSANWIDAIEASLPPSLGRRARATLYAAVINGLMLDFFSTDDLERTTEALRTFLAMKHPTPAKAP